MTSRSLLALEVALPPLTSLPPRHLKKPRPLPRLDPCSSGFLSPASRLNAGGALGHGRCSAHDQKFSPSFVRADT